jgi:hypothetical protein
MVKDRSPMLRGIVEKTVIGSVIIVINSTNNVLKFKTISKNCQKPRLSGPGNSTLNKGA